MHRTLGSAATILLLACPCVAQETTASTEFNQITQSPPVLNCAGRVIVTQNGGQYQGTVLMRGQVYIRDAFGHIVATSTPPGDYSPNNPFYKEVDPYTTQDHENHGSWNCHVSTDVILDYGDPFNVSSDSYQEVCPGQRGALRQEYIDKGVTFVPNCGDFTQSVPTPSRYSFGQWNSGTYSWAFLRATVTSNTECFLQESGTNPPLSSGYRNPVRQQDFGSVNSRHVHGDAADLDTPNAPDNALWNTLRLYAKGGACSDACVEPRSLTPGHFHVDYRGSCPAGW